MREGEGGKAGWKGGSRQGCVDQWEVLVKGADAVVFHAFY